MVGDKYSLWHCHSGSPLHLKCSKCLPTLLQTHGIRFTCYLDLLLLDFSVRTLSANIQRIIKFLQISSWIINFPKSALQPLDSLGYLGLILDTAQARIFLPQEKIACLRSSSQTLRSQCHPSICFCMTILGLIVASFEAIPFAQFHSRPFECNVQNPILGSLNYFVQSSKDLPDMVDP